MKNMSIIAFTLIMACGGEASTDGDPNRIDDPNRINDPNGNDPSNERQGKVTRCLGPSCPKGECGFSNDCSAYQGFDALDSSLLCRAATGSQQFCLRYEVPKDDGYVDIFEEVVSCADPTVVKISCSAGCGYNYSPDDCGVCNEDSGCALD